MRFFVNEVLLGEAELEPFSADRLIAKERPVTAHLRSPLEGELAESGNLRLELPDGHGFRFSAFIERTNDRELQLHVFGVVSFA